MVAHSLSDFGIPSEQNGTSEVEMEAEAATVPPVKRKRGRPRKSEAAVTPGAPGGESGGDGATPQKETGIQKLKGRPRKKRGEIPVPTSVDVSLIGHQVTGVLDGTFDAGYLLSVRVGSTDTILRGVVFGPGLSVPISSADDVVPGVKHVKREEKVIPTPPKPIVAPISLPFVPTQTPLPPPGTIPPTSAVLEAAAAVFKNPATASPPILSTGLTAALQQLPGGGYSPDQSSLSHAAYQSEGVQQMHVNVQSGV